jgi:UDP-N-acetylglucosamine diphosphorylase / glucose-1-phosphate thymidylyltransferase / UDP-N-acetylgalactosamine diphosphorylase / glucosamine-1-phosphate N-acetyltransferase / galactosamine-1-phosphate N-acetyltransferase
MKALVLAAGRGRRMEDLSEDTNKCLIPMRGKPLIEYSLDAALSIREIDEIVVTVGYQAESIVNRYGIDYHGKRVSYRIQVDRKGLVHAIESARPNLRGDDFFLFLGDEVVINGRYTEMMATFRAERLMALCGVVRTRDADQIRKTYGVIEGEGRRIFRLIEKPEKAINDVQGTGNCLFRSAILDYIDAVPINQRRNEKELPDLIQCAIDAGEIVRSFDLCDFYINVNTPDEMRCVEANWPRTAGTASTR